MLLPCEPCAGDSPAHGSQIFREGWPGFLTERLLGSRAGKAKEKDLSYFHDKSFSFMAGRYSNFGLTFCAILISA
jgi:hypothetical protein